WTFFFIFFFFQAEDGIRDRTVTGVQTCALPIFPDVVVHPDDRSRRPVDVVEERGRDGLVVRRTDVHRGVVLRHLAGLVVDDGLEIGRASCRERVEDSVGGGSVKEE